MPDPSYETVVDEAVEYILSLRSMKNVKDAIWKAYYELGAKCTKTCGYNMTVLILVAPCYGFGDIIFAIKVGKYLQEWYSVKVTYLTTHSNGFQKMGIPQSDIIELKSKSKNIECRRFSRLVPNRVIPVADLIFVAPVPTNYDASLSDVKKLVKTSNMFNTYFFSEYNHPDQVDFPTGVGGNNLGIFLNNTPVQPGKPVGLKNPFAVAYITDTTSGYERCLYAFMEMVAAKYSRKYKKFDIVVPPWVCGDINRFKKTIKNKVRNYYPSIVFVGKDKRVEWLLDDGPKIFTIRCDIFPLPIEQMLRLIKSSVPDILLTGDQSVSDALSCCPSKNIWYQIASWKAGFGKGLAKELPQKYLSKKTTSCGSMEGLQYKSNFSKFLKNWDFRKLAKPKLDSVFLAAKARKNSVEIRDFEDLVGDTKRLMPLKKMLREIIE